MLLDQDYNLKLADFGFSSSISINETHKGTNGYKAPEIHLGEKYSGASVDLFASGVILFIMHTGHPPFLLPSGADPYYKYIAQNLIHNFFGKHAKLLLQTTEGKEPFSEDFMNLVATMLLPKPCMRLAISEIKSHPWFLGKVATPEEVKAEIHMRLKLTEKGFAMDHIPNSQAATDIITEYSHRSLLLHSLSGDETDDGREVDRHAAKYCDIQSQFTKFFSTTPAEELFNCLACFAKRMTTDIKFHKKSYKARLSISKKNLLGGEETIKLVGKVLTVSGKDEDQFCVEFKKVSGDLLVFNELFKEAKMYFAGHVNVSQEG